MDSSKFPKGSEECSSSESGWTAYIASSEHEDNQERFKDKEEDDEKEANSDDSMASDASSAPSYQYGRAFNKRHGFRHANERKEAGKKERKKEDNRQRAEKIKAEKGEADRASRSKTK